MSITFPAELRSKVKTAAQHSMGCKGVPRLIGGKFRLTTAVHAATRTTTFHAATRTTICRRNQFTAWALKLYLCVIVKGCSQTEVLNILFSGKSIEESHII